MPANVDVVGIGSCGVDYFAIVPRLLGPEEKISASRMEIHAGGVTGNNLTQVARLGATTGWLGLIGDDENGRLIQKAFTDDAMDLSGVEVVKGEYSTMTWIPVDAQGERCIYMFPNINGKLSVDQVCSRFAPHIRRAKHFHTEASQLPIAPVKEAMQIAKQAKVRVLFDLDVSPSFFAQMNLGTQEELSESLKFVDVLKPCKAAAREITGESDYDAIADKLLDLGPSIVAITMGADGCLIASREDRVRVPAFEVKVVDTTGAGDAFMGGLSYGLLQGWDFARVGIFANACAALCCTKVGARAMARRDDVAAFIQASGRAAAIGS
ncbi:MAG TPA: carbohydrate kinase family protein [Candidatus Acidoferrales bacterium]|nr:carbohydrate kinase family protein [Candidatus Acidoferrales bacterium]